MHGAGYSEQFKRKVLLSHFTGEETEAQGLEKFAPNQPTCERQEQHPDGGSPASTACVPPGYLTRPGPESPT